MVPTPAHQDFPTSSGPMPVSCASSFPQLTHYTGIEEWMTSVSWMGASEKEHIDHPFGHVRERPLRICCLFRILEEQSSMGCWRLGLRVGGLGKGRPAIQLGTEYPLSCRGGDSHHLLTWLLAILLAQYRHEQDAGGLRWLPVWLRRGGRYS